LEDPGVGVRIILKWILEKRVGRAWTGSLRLRIGDRWRALFNETSKIFLTS
jgi:hypothetical protein